jgi:ketosteroid isomerase-like protein
MADTGVTPPSLEALLDAFNAHDVDAIMAFFTEDCVFDMPRGPAPGGRRLIGKEQVRAGVQARFDGIPDIRYADDRHWVCGDRGVSEWTIRGTQANGEPIEVRGCDLFEFAGGRISRKDSYWKIVD